MEAAPDRPNIIQRLLSQFVRPGPVENTTQKKKTSQEKESWDERKSRAEQLLQRLQQVKASPNHPARTILDGFDPKPSFLAHYPSLMQVVENLINVTPGNINTTLNDPNWVSAHIVEVESWRGVITDVNDLGKINIISTKLRGKLRDCLGGEEYKYRKAIDKINEEAKYVRQGGGSESEEVYREKEKEERERYDTDVKHYTWLDVVDEDGNETPLPTQSEVVNKNGMKVIINFDPLTHVVTDLKGKPVNELTKEELKKAYFDLESGYQVVRKELSKQQVDGGTSHEQLKDLESKMEPFAFKIRAKWRELGGGTEIKDRFMYAANRDPGIIEEIKNSSKVMDYWFYRIMDTLLADKSHVESRELFGLYPAGDMDEFLKVVGEIPKTGAAWVDHYRVLLESIKQMHDQDYYAVHSSGDVKSFVQGAALCRNSYITTSLAHPGVATAWRAYENALLMIRDSNRGYTPPELFQYSDATGKLYWDELAESLFMDAVRAGQIKERRVGENGFYLYGADRKPVYDETKPLTEEDFSGEYGRLRLRAIMKMAKGLGVVSMRNLEIMGKSKGPGSGHKEFGADPGEGAFHSVPYEGIVRWLEPFVHWFSKYNQGGSRAVPILSMIISDDPRKIPDTAESVKDVYVALREGGLEAVMKKYTGKVDNKRLTDLENMFSFSGFFGTMSKWRVVDATMGFDDWQKGYLGGAIRLELNGGWAGDIVQGRFEGKIGGADFITVTRKYKEMYRQDLLNSGIDQYRDVANNPEEFARWWEKKGKKDIYKYQINKEMEEFKKNKNVKEALDKLTENLTTALNTKTWIEMVLRNPLEVAKLLETEENIHVGQTMINKRPIRQRIIKEILGVDIDADITSYRTPSEYLEQNLKQVARLEGAIFGVQQIAVSENRDLTLKDFDKAITDPVLNTQAKLYWQKVKNYTLGDFADGVKDRWMEKIGLSGADKKESRGLNINWEKLQTVKWDEVFNKKGSLLTKDWVDKKWRYLFSTDDVAWDKFDLDNLGERHPFRRAGDFSSHQEGVSLVTDYMNDHMLYHGDKKDLVEMLEKIHHAFRGSDVNVGYDVVGWMTQLSIMMYRKDDWTKIPILGPLLGMGKKHSIMQRMADEVSGGDAWGAMDVIEFLKMIKGKDLLPPGPTNPLTGEKWASDLVRYDFKQMKKRMGGTDADILYEWLSLGIPLAFLLTGISSATKKSEEEG